MAGLTRGAKILIDELYTITPDGPRFWVSRIPDPGLLQEFFVLLSEEFKTSTAVAFLEADATVNFQRRRL